MALFFWSCHGLGLGPLLLPFCTYRGFSKQLCDSTLAGLTRMLCNFWREIGGLARLLPKVGPHCALMLTMPMSSVGMTMTLLLSTTAWWKS